MITWARVEYTYNAWGEILSATGNMADTNPIRYRGYYYDAETELYYLQSRYYDPEFCRFISEDIYTTTDLKGILSSNMFAYCENNPISRSDKTGAMFFTLLGAVTGFISGAFVAMTTNVDESMWMDVALASAEGGAIAGVGVDLGLLVIGSGGTMALVAAIGLAYLSGGLGNCHTTAKTAKITNKEVSSTQLLGSFIIGGTLNSLSLGTSWDCAANTLQGISLNGLNSFGDSLAVGAGIGISTSIATEVGTRESAGHTYRRGSAR